MGLASRHVVDGALLVEFPEVSTDEANQLAVSLREQMLLRPRPEVLDAIPGARTLLVLFDPLTLPPVELDQWIRSLPASSPSRHARAFQIPVRYGGELGPDLEQLARDRGLTVQKAVKKHLDAEYRVAFIGFAAGFPYLTGLPEVLHAPRLASPRPRVAAGSVGIGGEYTGIYPAATPGGWRLIGRAAVKLFDAAEDPPSLLAPGDRVHFEETSKAEFSNLLAGMRTAPASALDTPRVFRVVRPGLHSSIQGAPRFGFGALGVPPGGAMDLDALMRANVLLDNPVLAPGLEVTLSGPELEVLRGCRFCLAGAPVEADLDGRSVPLERPCDAVAGQRLRIGAILRGVRTYLAVSGGLANPRFAPEGARRIQKDELLYVAKECIELQPSLSRENSAGPTSPSILRSVLGPQEERFSAKGIETFFSSEYRVSVNSDRRGVRLEGPPAELIGPSDIAPEGTAPGSVQVPGNALPIILGPDRPVTGGYAKIATVIGADLGRIAQARPGDRVRFERVTVQEALAARTAKRC